MFQDLAEKTKQSQEKLRQLEGRARESTSQVRQMEAALNLCKDEIKTYISALEDSKEIHEREIVKRDEKVRDDAY